MAAGRCRGDAVKRQAASSWYLPSHSPSRLLLRWNAKRGSKQVASRCSRSDSRGSGSRRNSICDYRREPDKNKKRSGVEKTRLTDVILIARVESEPRRSDSVNGAKSVSYIVYL